jgi:acetone carboxylase, gamma subunit
MPLVRITEYLDIDTDTEMWRCNRCGRELISARENYKTGCLVYERDPDEILPPIFPPDKAEFHLGVVDGYGVFVEFYCPGCGIMIENELLPEGYPPTYDLELDIDALKAKVGQA